MLFVSELTLCFKTNFVFLYANATKYVLANVTAMKDITDEYRSIIWILQNNPVKKLIFKVLRNTVKIISTNTLVCLTFCFLEWSLQQPDLQGYWPRF